MSLQYRGPPLLLRSTLSRSYTPVSFHLATIFPPFAPASSPMDVRRPQRSFALFVVRSSSTLPSSPSLVDHHRISSRLTLSDRFFPRNWRQNYSTSLLIKGSEFFRYLFRCQSHNVRRNWNEKRAFLTLRSNSSIEENGEITRKRFQRKKREK